MHGMTHRKDGELLCYIAFPAGCGIIGTMIRSKGGVDVEAGHHNNTPSLRSTIISMVAIPAGTCRIQRMINENNTTQDQDLDAYWEAMAERFETDSADIGCEFDT